MNEFLKLYHLALFLFLLGVFGNTMGLIVFKSMLKQRSKKRISKMRRLDII